MQVAIDISLYPLREDYEGPIIRFIQQLRAQQGLQVHTNDLSTQLSGDYDLAMNTLQAAIKATFLQGGTHSFGLKILNVAITPGGEVEI